MDRKKTVRQLKALGEPSRLDLFLRVSEGEVGGTKLLEATGLSQPNLSRHLKVLREAGVIEERWQGRGAFYRLSEDPFPRMIAAQLAAHAGTGGATVPSGAPNHIHRDESNNATQPTDTEEVEGAPAPLEDWLL